jgi:hypothetical protein
MGFYKAIVELKVVVALPDVHLPQCRNDLRAMGRQLCLLIYFGRPKIEFRCVTAKPDREQESPSSPSSASRKKNRRPHPTDQSRYRRRDGQVSSRVGRLEAGGELKS